MQGPVDVRSGVRSEKVAGERKFIALAEIQRKVELDARITRVDRNDLWVDRRGDVDPAGFCPRVALLLCRKRLRQERTGEDKQRGNSDRISHVSLLVNDT